MAARRTCRILHISDLHVGSDKDSPWRTRRVLGDAWACNLREIARDVAVDLVCLTGDIANWGTPEQYADASAFVDGVLRELNVPRERFFCVPGNHDIQRKVNDDAWRTLRERSLQVDRDLLSRWMAGAQPPLGIEDGWRAQIVERQGAYRQWLRDIGRADLVPGSATGAHAYLGYRVSIDVGVAGAPLHLIGLDSAWLAGDDHDAGKLRLTEDQVARLCSGPDGKRVSGWIVALVHHPLGDLADAADAKRKLADYGVGLLMHGHMHDPQLERWTAPPAQDLPISSAGCLYAGTKYPNSLQVIDLRLAEEGRLKPVRLWSRSWSDRAGWFNDDGLYAGSVNGRLQLEQAPVPVARVTGSVVGRDAEIARLEAAFVSASAAGAPSAASNPHGPSPATATAAPHCVIDGMAGVGKSWLATHFVDDRWLPFARGAFGERARVVRLTLDPVAYTAPTAVQLAEQVAACINAPGPSDTIWERLGALLGGETLLVFDNADDRAQASAVGELVNRLPCVPALVTARYGQLAGEDWTRIALQPLDEDDAVRQLEVELGEGAAFDAGDLRQLARSLGGLSLALHIAAGHLRAGHTVRSFLAELTAQGLNLEPASAADPRLTENRARAIVRSSFDISWKLWQRTCEALPHRRSWPAALIALAYGPAAPVGASLGAAIAGLDADGWAAMACDGAAHSLIQISRQLDDRRHSLHPLIAEFLRQTDGSKPADTLSRMVDWAVARLPDVVGDKDQGARWAQLGAEQEALVFLLVNSTEVRDLARLAQAGRGFAGARGPYGAWRDACMRGMSNQALLEEDRSKIAGTLCMAARRSGDLDLALSTAEEWRTRDLGRGAIRGAAIASSAIADVHQVRGQLEEALRIRQEDELPILDSLRDLHGVAITMAKIGDIHRARGDLDAALRTYESVVLPAYRMLHDEGGVAMAVSAIADIQRLRGRPRDDAIGALHESAETAGRRGDVRQRAITNSSIATHLQDQDKHEDALRIFREDVLPVFDSIGDKQSSALAAYKTAQSLLALRQADEAVVLLRKAVPHATSIGDSRLCGGLAASLGHSAELLGASGQYDEAELVLREDVVPLFERIGDQAGKALALSRLAAIRQARWPK